MADGAGQHPDGSAGIRERRRRNAGDALRRRGDESTRALQFRSGEQHQFNRNHTRHQSEQSGFELGGEHSSRRRTLHTAHRDHCGGGGVLCRAHRQAGLLLRLYAGCGRADCGDLPYCRARRRPRGEYREPTGSGRGRIAIGVHVDRLSNQSPGAHCNGLPQRGAGDGAGRCQYECTVERHLQGEPQQLFERCVAGRCAASQRAFDEPECRSGGAHSEGDVQPKPARPCGI